MVDGGSPDGDDRPARLAAILGRGRVVIVGVGNRGRGDDGFGPAVVAALRDRIPAPVVDAGPAPENATSAIAQLHPETVLWVDAGEISRPPGQWLVCDSEALAGGGLSGHAGSLGLVARYLAVRTGARSFCLLAQPARIGGSADGVAGPSAGDAGPCGAELSEPMARAVRDVSRLIVDVFGRFTQQRGSDASCLPEANS